jgi:hypothetical protein
VEPWRLLTRVDVVSARKSGSEEMCTVDGSLTAGNVKAESTKFGVWGNVKTLSLLQLPESISREEGCSTKCQYYGDQDGERS